MKSERLPALQLRREGYGIGEISNKLKVSKSTVSYWCKDLKLSEAQHKQLDTRTKTAGAAALRRWVESKRAYRQKKVSALLFEGMKEVGTLSKRDHFIAGLALYWGEGYKHGSDELGFTNSDPAMILFFIAWLRKIYGITPDRLILRVSVNAIHILRIKEIERYWSRTTKIPLLQFTQTSLIAATSKKRYSNETKHYGTLRIKVRKGTDLRRKIIGSIEQLKKI